MKTADEHAFFSLIARSPKLSLREISSTAWAMVTLTLFVTLATLSPLAPYVGGMRNAHYLHVASAVAVVAVFVFSAINLRRLSIVRGHLALAEASPNIVYLADAQGRCIYVNARWTELTGQTFDEALGQGWRDFVHPDDREPDRKSWEADVGNGIAHEFQLRFRSRSGEYLWHLARALPIHDGAHNTIAWMGTVANIHSQERVAASLGFLSEAGQVLSETLDIETSLQRLTKVSAPVFADYAAVWLTGEESTLRVVARSYANAEFEELIKQRRTTSAPCKTLREVMQGRGPYFCRRMDQESAEIQQHWAALDPKSVIVVPLESGTQILGVLVLTRCSEHSSFDEADLAIAVTLARRAGIAVENARLYANRQTMIETLRTAFLPAFLPQVDGITFEAIYKPAAEEAQVGGDWYDAFHVGEGRIALSVGDMMGHGVSAATAMVHIREAIRAAAASYGSDPAAVLAFANRALCAADRHSLATAIFAVYDMRSQQLTYASAGHPAPIIVRAQTCLPLIEGRGIILGIDEHAEYTTGTVLVEPDDRIILYTDGLIEMNRNVLEGEQALYQALRQYPIARAVETLLESGQRDDIALLCLHLSAASILENSDSGWRFHSDDAGSATSARTSFVAYLRSKGYAQEQVSQAELVFGELVSNVVRHAPGPIDIELRCKEEVALLKVADRGRWLKDQSHQTTLPSDVFAEGGRGIYIVESLVGPIFVRHRAGGGSEVAVRLKLHSEMAVLA